MAIIEVIRPAGKPDSRPRGDASADGTRNKGVELKYAETEEVEAGQSFKTKSGIMVETTGVTVHIESTDVFVHEVVITEGTGEGNKFLYNLDTGEPA